MKLIRQRFCITRPNGALMLKTVATTQREAWWQFILAHKAEWVIQARTNDIHRDTLGIGTHFKVATHKRGWRCCRVRVTVEARR